MVPEAGRAEEAQRAAGLKKVPLDGFMGEADWNGVCLEMRTPGRRLLADSGDAVINPTERPFWEAARCPCARQPSSTLRPNV